MDIGNMVTNKQSKGVWVTKEEVDKIYSSKNASCWVGLGSIIVFMAAMISAPAIYNHWFIGFMLGFISGMCIGVSMIEDDLKRKFDEVATRKF